MALDPNINTREFQKFRDAGTSLTKVAVAIEQDAGSPVPVEINLDPPAGYSRELAFNKITSVASGSETTILTQSYLDDAYIYLIKIGGTNKAIYRLYLNATQVDEIDTYFNDLTRWGFNFGQYGLKLVSGDQIDITVEHVRPYTGDFFTKVIGIKK